LASKADQIIEEDQDISRSKPKKKIGKKVGTDLSENDQVRILLTATKDAWTGTEGQIDQLVTLLATRETVSVKDPQSLLELVRLLQTDGFEATYQYVETQANATGLIWSQPRLLPEKRFLERESVIYRTEDAVGKSVYKCRYCGSKNTTMREVQMRSGDEAMNILIACQQCGKRWKI